MEKDQNIINLYKSGMSLGEVAKSVGYKSPNSVKNILIKHGVERRGKAGYKNPDLRHDYFKNIDTENKAYLLGYLIADGSVSERDKSQPLIRMELNRVDQYIVEKLKEEVQTDNKLELTRKDCCAIRFHSKEMFEDLAKYGVIPNKTKLTFFPESLIPKEHMNHFIRGVFDGDGWVHLRGKGNSTISFCGGAQLMTGLRNYFSKELGLYNVSVLDYDYHTESRIMYCSERDVLTLSEFLYKDASIYLTRKKDKCDHFKNIISEYRDGCDQQSS